VYLGIDIGSVSLNLVLLDDQMRVVKERYIRTRGKPLETALAALEEVFGEVPPSEIDGVAFAGAGTAVLGELYGIKAVNEVIAQAKATAALHPEVRTIIEIGGEDSKLILLEEDPSTGRIRIRDFAMNTLCAAGTGSFLDQQASRLGVSIEGEWGEMATKSVHVPRIAGRCSVFAKSDMIHLQQEGTPDYDIVAGLCFAMARNFKAVIGKAKEFDNRIAFQGGVAANAGMIRAFTETLGLADGELLIPAHYASMGAIGAVLTSKERGELGRIPSVEPLQEYLASRHWGGGELHPALVDDGYPLTIEPDAFPPGLDPVDIFVGVDVGSISTNVVAIDSDSRVLAREYLMTAGRPLAAVTDGLYKVWVALEERGGKGRVRVRGCATTGSGRYLTGDFIGADIVKNEITAHATGAIFIRPEVDTVFEIGGQDSKYISIDGGAVVDFAMNKVCAAGTGSFIEEQSERLGVDLTSGEYNRLALSADEPPAMGERCTVFMETDINRNQQKGVEVDDLCAGLCYSIVQNYLNRVVEKRRIGSCVFFQGGTAYNRGVKAAFEKVTGKPIIVPPHHDVVGAIGMALIAHDWYAETGKETTFRGFDLRDVEYSFDTFECKDCANRCEIHVVEIKGEPGPEGADDIVNSYVCPYVQSVPFLVRAAMPDVDWEEKMVSPTIHFSHGRKALRKELVAMAARLGVAKSRARRAIDTALAAHERFKAALQARGREVLASLDADDIALAIVSRPYNGCDPGLNLNIPEKLRDLGRLAIPLDMLPLDGEDISAEHPHMYWKYGQQILAGVRIIARDRRLYPVYITNFGCGPDSFITKYVASELGGKPCLVLEVDEHSADVGAITRCEAFLDSLKGVRESEARQGGRKARLAQLDYSRKAYGKRTIYIPYMDDHGYAMAAAMRAGGVEARQMPMSDEDTIMWGRKYTSGKECYPCIITTGDFLRQIHSPGFDPDRSAFFMPTAFGPCRFGQYNKFQRMMLDDLGLEDVPLVLLDQDKDFQGDLKNLGTDFRKLAWSGIVFVDTLQKMLRETRPYEANPGECDQLYEKYLRKCEQVIEGRGDLVALAREARSTFEGIATDRSHPRPRIGIVGEVFVRSNQFTNNFMVRKIETLGGEAVLPPFEEWVNYIGWSRKADARMANNWKRLLVEKITDLIQGREKHKVLRQFEGAVRHFFDEPPSDDVVALGEVYLSSAVRGEPILSMGRCMEYVHDGCDGVINLHPFNCMPGTIVNALLTKFQKDHNMPVLKVAYDGLEQATEMVRIEAFMHQCGERFKARLQAAGNGAGTGIGGAIAAARSGR